MGKSGILVVDDDRDSREMLAELLMHQGYHSIMAANGKDALRRLEYILPDLLITDLMMPEMDGAALLRVLAADDRFRAIPTIVLTSLDADAAGAMLGDDLRKSTVIVGKPLRIAKLLHVVKHRLAGRRR